MTHRLLPKPVAGVDDARVDDATEVNWELDADRVRCVVSFSFRSVVEPSWGDQGSFALGVVFLYLVP